MKKIVNAVIDKLDHHDLNTLPYFQDRNPSSEHIAGFIYDEVRPQLTSRYYDLYSVMVMETDSQGLTYYGENRQ